MGRWKTEIRDRFLFWGVHSQPSALKEDLWCVKKFYSKKSHMAISRKRVMVISCTCEASLGAHHVEGCFWDSYRDSFFRAKQRKAFVWKSYLFLSIGLCAAITEYPRLGNIKTSAKQAMSFIREVDRVITKSVPRRTEFVCRESNFRLWRRVSRAISPFFSYHINRWRSSKWEPLDKKKLLLGIVLALELPISSSW